MPDIDFHDGHLVAHRANLPGSLDLHVQLDPVWNGGSSRVIRITLSGITNMPQVTDYFTALDAADRQAELIRQGLAPWDGQTIYESPPTVLRLDLMEDRGTVLVSLELLSAGPLDVICRRVECDERASLPFAR